VPHLIEVAFKGNRKEFFLWEADEAPALRAAVIVDADRGEDLGTVHSTGELAEQRSDRVPHGLFGAPATRVAKRLATPEELRRLDEVRAQDEVARRRAMERVKANALVMKVTDAEWQWDRKKLTFYFTAEKRVDFRTLVRELASMFRTRIELKQIGVRDEAKRLDGVGRCGRQYCSASWLPELRPVNLGVAKDQRLSLNPSQISGACGRLMCCLRYEHEFYVASRKKYPKEGKPVRTSRGEEKVLSNDIFRERVTLRGVEGEVRIVPLAALREEMLAAGDALAHALATAAVAAELAASVPPPELDEDDDELSADEALDTEHSPDHLAVGTAVDPAMDVTLEWPSPRVDAEGRRPQRRRGRRGGRRNWPGGANGARGPRDGGDGPKGDQ
jgi:cell fate regulator YaaT (PSP1 superfamily)